MSAVYECLYVSVFVGLRAFLYVYAPLFACSLCIREIGGKPNPVLHFLYQNWGFTLSDNKIADDLCDAIFSGI